MAVGNIGIALLCYSMIVHDPSHRDYLNHFAYRYLKLALTASDNEVDLSMAVHIEEQNRGETHSEEKIIPQITLQEYGDEWKI